MQDQSNPQIQFSMPGEPLQMPNDSMLSPFRKVVELWPYLFVVVSIAGLLYIAVNVVRQSG
jgi:hypothetical protein